MQEALLRAWQAWPKLRESERFDPWFSQILVNVCRNRLRRRPPVRWMPLGDDLDGPTVADPFQAALARDELGKLAAGRLSRTLRPGDRRLQPDREPSRERRSRDRDPAGRRTSPAPGQRNLGLWAALG